EPERLAALPEPAGDEGEDMVAGRMVVGVVDALEVVDVDEAERERRSGLLGGEELALEPLVEVAMVAEPRQRVRQREPHRAELPEGRALVQRDRDQRPDERGGE